MIVHGKKTLIVDVQNFALAKGGKLISTSYSNILAKYKWECDSGHIFEATFNHVKNRGQWCPICGKIKSHNSLIERMKDPIVRDKISKSHLKRLNKLNKYSGKTQRKLAGRIRESVTGLLRRPQKYKGFLKYLGCSIEQFKQYLESKFKAGMTWENRGFSGWHVDHIKPLNSYDLTDSIQFEKACHYTNLQPLWALDNQVKYDKYNEHKENL